MKEYTTEEKIEQLESALTFQMLVLEATLKDATETMTKIIDITNQIRELGEVQND